MSSPVSIVVAFASAGSGHRLSAEAVAHELRGAGGSAVDVAVVDALETGSARAAALADGRLTHSPVGRAVLSSLTPALQLASRGFAERLLAMQPAVIVSTHPLTTAVAARLTHSGRIRARIVTTPTDFDVAGATPRRGVSLHCAASDACAELLIARDVPASAVTVTGIPVRTQFTMDYDTSAARSHFGLPADRRVLLAIAGSSDPAYYARLKEALAVSLPALASLPDTSVVVVAGRDAAFSGEMTSRSKGFGTTNVRILDYVEHMAPLIACADLVIAKPVGLVCAECVDSGVPLVLAGGTDVHERANARALATAGAAVVAEDPSTLAERARDVVSSPKRLARMREATASLARPFAAADVARHALGLAGVQAAEPGAAS